MAKFYNYTKSYNNLEPNNYDYLDLNQKLILKRLNIFTTCRHAHKADNTNMQTIRVRKHKVKFSLFYSFS